MKFTLNGGDQAGQVPPSIAKLTAFLDSQPDGQLWTLAGACARIKVSAGTISSHPHAFLLRDYHIKERRATRHVYGNRRTIAAYRKEYYEIPD